MSFSSKFNAVHMITIKRNNIRPHTDEELTWWIEAYTSGAIPEYQMSAWLMAVCWRGMTQQETATLTRQMVLSGTVLTWEKALQENQKQDGVLSVGSPSPSLSIPLVDKHSTGGVGDKISLILAPLVAACGLRVPMMAGRGLDHTGGTLDKLESIPGYQANLDVEKFQSVVKTVGCSIVSTTREIVPADKQLYALRDVTGTVSSIPLQTASIVSKKIAEAPDSLVLDVKYGCAAFQSTLQEATELACSMISTAESNGLVPTTAFLTRMDHPIGHAVGNWLEVKECVSVLRTGRGAADLIQLAVVQAAQLLYQSGKVSFDFETCVSKVYKTLKSGMAFVKFRSMVQAHGGDVDVLDNVDSYPQAQHHIHVVSKQDGYISDIDALTIGRVAVDLGAGRQVAHQAVEPRAGIYFYKRVGNVVTSGEVVATLYTQQDEGGTLLENALLRVENAISYSQQPVVVPPVVSHICSRANGGESGVNEFEMPQELQSIAPTENGFYHHFTRSIL